MAQVGAAYLDLDFVYAPRPPGWSNPARRLAQYLGVSTSGCTERLRELKLYLPPLYVIVSRDMRNFDFSVRWPNNPSWAAIYSNKEEAVAMMFPTGAPNVRRHQARIGTGAPPRECPFRLHAAVCCAPLDARPTFCCAAHAPPGGCQCARAYDIQAAEQRRVTLPGLFGSEAIQSRSSASARREEARRCVLEGVCEEDAERGHEAARKIFEGSGTYSNFRPLQHRLADFATL